MDPTVTLVRRSTDARVPVTARRIMTLPSSDRQFASAVENAVAALNPAESDTTDGLQALVREHYPDATVVDRDPLGGLGREVVWYAFRDGIAKVRPRRSILVVDDDAALAALIGEACGEERFEVRIASNGAAALEVLASWAPDLILLDLQMPMMSGEEFARAYLAAPPPHAPLVVLTGARDAATRLDGLKVRSILAKPFELDVLARLVDRYA